MESDRKVPRKGTISQIVRNLYIGDEDIANEVDYLKYIGIKRIIVAGEQLKEVAPADFIYLHLAIKDSKFYKISQHFKTVNQFIDEALGKGQPVLIHCAYGKSRSCTLGVAYLMHCNSIDYPDAMNYVRRKRPVAKPNIGFIQQLQRYSQEIQP